MKSHDAAGFLVMGTLMAFLPALLPAYFPANGPDGTSTSALWLEVMGILNNLVGAGLVARAVPAALGRLLAWKRTLPVEMRPAERIRIPAQVLRPVFIRSALPLYRELKPRSGRQIAA